MINYKKIGQRIQNKRKEMGLSQEQLAEQVGISLSFYGHIERGTRKASVETLARLSKVLEMDMHYIVFGHSSGLSVNSELLRELRELVQYLFIFNPEKRAQTRALSLFIRCLKVWIYWTLTVLLNAPDDAENSCGNNIQNLSRFML